MQRRRILPVSRYRDLAFTEFYKFEEAELRVLAKTSGRRILTAEDRV